MLGFCMTSSGCLYTHVGGGHTIMYTQNKTMYTNIKGACPLYLHPLKYGMVNIGEKLVVFLATYSRYTAAAPVPAGN